MDDTCAVCAESLEWVAYGPCGHREVCSTCVVRLRFICDDRKCCICKTESNVVFVTKAMGDYTRMISDFSKLPSEPREGPVPGSYWYHEDTQAFFDDVEYYKMVKAMCRLSCSVCDKAAAEEQPPQEGYRRKQRFRNIGQLKAHLNHQHRLFMCDLCLENRQAFICEQKLYTRAQLNQHRRTGDSVVDGTESERGGFSGHPMCEFCRTSFYGDGELYTHMSTDHFTCHICQRLHPGQYEYYKNYDDLECHFRQKHQLCEDEACLAKKFIVFQTPEELKRHNTLEHGGRMSRSKRNAVLQIPTSFRYRSNNDSGYHRGRRRSFLRDSSPDSELSMALERSILDDGLPNPSPSLDSVEPHEIDPLVQPYESLSTGESEPLRYRQAVSQSSLSTPLVGSSFPPLSTPSSSQQRSLESKNTLAARLRRQNNATVLNVAQPRTGYPALRPTPAAPSLRPTPAAPSLQPTPAAPSLRPTPAAPSPRPALVIPAQVSAVAIPASRPAPAIPAPRAGAVPSSSSPAPASASSAPWPSLVPSSGSVQTNPAPLNSSGSSSYAGSLHNRSTDEPGVGMVGSWASKSKGGGSRMKHSSSVPNLVESRSFDPVSDFPPVSAVQPKRAHLSGKSMKMEDIQTANKSLVESMRAALQNDENKFSAFKEISQEYRQNLIDTREYIEYVKQFELTHLIPDMARLCPDTWKQKELLEAYNAIEGVKGSSSSKKDKGKKVIYSGESRRQESLADNVISTVKSLQSQFRPSEEVEVLEKDGYRASRGKTTVSGIENPVELRGSSQHTSTQASENSSAQASMNGAGNKQKKKTSKFHRLRLGEDSSAAIFDLRNSAGESISAEVDNGPGLPSRSVWRGGGAQRLFAK